MPFTEKTPEFLFENHLKDSKEWFHEHKSDYEKYIKEPFKEFVEIVAPTMNVIDDKISCDPKRLSRIYRDARYSKGQSVFRNYIWYTFSRTREGATSLPCFYFSVSPTGFDYGLGYYCAGTESMNAVRRLVLSGDISFVKAKRAYSGQNKFILGGETYKRDRYPEQPEENKLWLNRKNIYLSYESKDFGVLYSKELGSMVAEDFKQISPVYHMFMKAEQIRGQ